MKDVIKKGFERNFKTISELDRKLIEQEDVIDSVRRHYQVEQNRTKELKVREKSLEKTVSEVEKALYTRMVTIKEISEELESEKSKKKYFLGKYDEM
jgi:septal ring factor EnvC (AmiA/AmiB activator)